MCLADSNSLALTVLETFLNLAPNVLKLGCFTQTIRDFWRLLATLGLGSLHGGLRLELSNGAPLWPAGVSACRPCPRGAAPRPLSPLQRPSVRAVYH